MVESALPDLETRIGEVLDRWPSAGLAVGVIRDGSLAWFRGYGVADTVSGAPVTQDTVFRIASITKTFTAIAVMQLWEHGLIDLDAPASDYLRAFELVPANASFRPATARHLLTHTGGIGYWRRLSDVSVREPGRATSRCDRRHPLPTTTGAVCWSRSCRARSGCTPTTASPHSARSSRTSPAIPMNAICASTSSKRSPWSPLP